MTAADFTPVTPEAAAGFLDAALFDGAPADERLLDAWATIVAQGEQIEHLRKIVGRCKAWSGIRGLKSRCTEAAEHAGPHKSDEHGYVVWTNR